MSWLRHVSQAVGHPLSFVPSLWPLGPPILSLRSPTPISPLDSDTPLGDVPLLAHPAPTAWPSVPTLGSGCDLAPSSVLPLRFPSTGYVLCKNKQKTPTYSMLPHNKHIFLNPAIYFSHGPITSLLLPKLFKGYSELVYSTPYCPNTTLSKCKIEQKIIHSRDKDSMKPKKENKKPLPRRER